MIDEIKNSDEDILTFEENKEKIKPKKNKLSMEERMEQNKKSIIDQINIITIRKERIQKILKSDHAGPKMSQSVWSEQNLFENTPEGRIYSMSDVNLKTLIDFHSEENQTILDPFAGYLNSAETILKMGRKYIGYEIRETYFNKLDSKLKTLKDNRDMLGLELPYYEIYNKDSSNMGKHNVDMILTTIPDPIYSEERRRIKENADEEYEKYLENIVKPILNAYDNLKDNGFFIMHLKDNMRGFKFRPATMDIANILRPEMPIKYILILSENRSSGGNKSLGNSEEMFKFYSEQTFPHSHQVVFCFFKGEGRLREKL
jgi:DNA modification methylase